MGIKLLVELGADINDPDSEGNYPIQHLLQLDWTPLDLIAEYTQQMVDLGAKINDILSDDPDIVQTLKLYTLHDMKDGYEWADGLLCVVIPVTYSEGPTYERTFKKVQIPLLLTETGSNPKLHIDAKRNNLIDVERKDLLEKYPQFGDEMIYHNDEEKEELEMSNMEKESEDDVRDKNDEIILEMSKFVK